MPNLKPKFLNDCDQEAGIFWSQLKNGEKEGLEKLYKAYSSELFRYGMAIKPNRSFIKDCIQELFLDLWKYRNTLRPTDNVKLYLFKSLSNKIVREVTKDLKIYHDGEISDFETVLMEESEEEKMINLQRDESIQVKLKDGLANLPLRQREVIQLVFFEKMPYEEVSKILGITIDSSYTLAWKAVNSLKKSILMLVLLLSIF